MKEKLNVVCKSPLFEDICPDGILRMLTCVEAVSKHYKKGEFILQAGNEINFVGIVISGSVKILRGDATGNQNIIGEILMGDMFGEVFACADISYSPVSIMAVSDSEVLFFDYKRIIASCSADCDFRQKVVFNMLKIMARKNLGLNQKIDIITKKTLREKIMAYFEIVSGGERKFKVSLNREEMAEFLSADRSALSSELSKMQKENIIRYKKNEFELL